MHDDHRDMLNEADKGISEAKNVLSRLWRQIVYDLGISPYRWGALMIRYLDDPTNKVPKNGKDRSSVRGNLNKELRRDKMTWKVFFKGLKFLSPLRIRFEVHLSWPGKPDTIHSVTIPIAEINPSIPPLEDDDET